MDLKVVCPPTLLPGSRILLVGESPGREECAEGRGFVGPAGRVLQRAAKLAGLDWDSLSLSNIVKRPPDGGYSSEYFRQTFYETQETPTLTKTGKVSKKTRRVTVETPELLAGYEVLRDEISRIRPNLVVAVGGEAFKALTGHTEIHNWRGSVLASGLVKEQKVLPIVHPSFIQRGQWSDFWPLVYDLKKAKRESEFPEIRREPYEAIIPSDVEQIQEITQQITGPWSVDIETRGGSIACIGLGYKQGSSYSGLCIPVQTTRGARWTLGEEQKVWEYLDGLFKSNPLLVGQNLPYDLDYLKDYGIRPRGILLDTMTAHCLLYPDWTKGYKGLDFLTSFYLDDVPYYKNDGKTWGHKTANEDLWVYNLKDCVHTLRVSEKQEQQLRSRGLWGKYQEEIIPLTWLALEMQERRLPVNDANRLVLDRILQSELGLVHQALTDAVGHEINTESPQQVQNLLYKALQLPARKKRGTGKATADENALRELGTMYQNPILDLIIKERHLAKRKSTFVDCELEDG